MKKQSNKDYFVIIFSIGLSLFAAFDFFTKEKIKSEKDLQEIQGTLENYSFTDDTGFKSRGRKYYLWLTNYDNQFQIKADYIPYFHKYEFENYVKAGDILYMTIPKSQTKNLNSGSKIFLTSLNIKNRTFLDKKIVFEIEKSFLSLWAAIGFLVFGVAFFKFSKK